MPLIVDNEDGACDGVALLVAVFAEEVAVQSPLESHGVLGLNEGGILTVEGCPHAINLYLDGFTTEEIGRLMGISRTNVTTRIGRIKDKLRKMVKCEW